jgi:hypothetical protein
MIDDEMEIPSTLRKRLQLNCAELNLFDDHKSASIDESRTGLNRFENHAPDLEETSEETEAARAFEKYLARGDGRFDTTTPDFLIMSKDHAAELETSQSANKHKLFTQNRVAHVQNKRSDLCLNEANSKLSHLRQVLEPDLSLKFMDMTKIDKPDRLTPETKKEKTKRKKANESSLSLNDSCDGSSVGLKRIIEESIESVAALGAENTDRDDLCLKRDSIVIDQHKFQPTRSHAFDKEKPTVGKQESNNPTNFTKNYKSDKLLFPDNPSGPREQTKNSHVLLTKYFDQMLNMSNKLRSPSPNPEIKHKKDFDMREQLERGNRSKSNIVFTEKSSCAKAQDPRAVDKQNTSAMFNRDNSVSSKLSKGSTSNARLRNSPLMRKGFNHNYIEKKTRENVVSLLNDNKKKLITLNSNYSKADKGELFSEVFGRKLVRPTPTRNAIVSKVDQQLGYTHTDSLRKKFLDIKESSNNYLKKPSQRPSEASNRFNWDSSFQKTRKYSIKSIETGVRFPAETRDLPKKPKFVHTYDSPSKPDHPISSIVNKRKPLSNTLDCSSGSRHLSPGRSVKTHIQLDSLRSGDRILIEPKLNIANKSPQIMSVMKKMNFHVELKKGREQSPVHVQPLSFKEQKKASERTLSEKQMCTESSHGSSQFLNNKSTKLIAPAEIRPGISGKIDVLSRHLIQSIAEKHMSAGERDRSHSNLSKKHPAKTPQARTMITTDSQTHLGKGQPLKSVATIRDRIKPFSLNTAT